MPGTIDPADLSVFLAACDPASRRTIGELCRVVRAIAPGASEGIRFNALCFFRPDVAWGAIGGNICMIEPSRPTDKGRSSRPIRLSFIHGAALTDPDALLLGSGKSKRYVEVPSVEIARSPRIRRLIRQAASYHPGSE